MHWGRTLWSVLRRDRGGSPESRGLCHLLSWVDRWMHPKSGGPTDARIHPWHQCRDSEWGWGRGSEEGSGKQGESREAAEGVPRGEVMGLRWGQ